MDTSKSQLLDLERSAWEALSSSPEAATRFYSEFLASEVLILLPGGMVIDDRQAVIDSMGGTPWDSYQIEDERIVELGEGCAVVAYRATAVREGNEYRALFNSTFIQEDGEWRMAIHQQTPIE